MKIRDGEVAVLDQILISGLDPGEGIRSAYDQLRPAERVFVDEYTTTLDAKLAAKSLPENRRGNGAYVALFGSAKEMLRRPMIQAAIAEIFAARRARYEPTVKRIIEELSKIAFASQSDYMRINANGEPYYDFTGISAEAMAAISEVTVEDVVEGRGEDARDIRRIKVKLHDKLSALMHLAKLIGAVQPDTVNVNMNVTGQVETKNVHLHAAMTPQQMADAYAQSLLGD